MIEYNNLRHRLHRIRHDTAWDMVIIWNVLIFMTIGFIAAFLADYTYIVNVDSASCQDIPDLIEKYGAAERIENKIKVCEYLERHR